MLSTWGSRFSSRILIVGGLLLAFSVAAAPQENPKALVSEMVHNELNTQRTPHYWMYLDKNTSKGKTDLKRVLQTKECWFDWPISTNGHPVSADERKKASDEIEQLVSNPEARNKERKQIDEDSSKADSLLKILPDAFLFTPAGESNGSIVLKFRPNPNYNPPSNEAKVFHAMAGTLVINAKEKRLAKLSGRLTQDVDFGFGILGKIRKGGTFLVVQSQVAPDDWELTLLDVHIDGRALFFHTIGEQQHEVMTQFQEVPQNVSLKQAAAMVENPEQHPLRASVRH